MTLAWVLHLDPESLQKAQERAQERLAIEQRRLTNRVVDRADDRKWKSAARKLGVDPNDGDMIETVT
jgi:topoisomerase IA-like protein